MLRALAVLIAPAAAAAAAAEPPALLRAEVVAPVSEARCRGAGSEALDAAQWRAITIGDRVTSGRKAEHSANILCHMGGDQRMVMTIMVASAAGEAAATRERDCLQQALRELVGPNPAAVRPGRGCGPALPPAGCGAASSNHLRLPRTCYWPAETIRFSWEGLTKTNDWISLDRADAPPESYGPNVNGRGTEKLTEGELTANGEPGDYELRVHYDWPSGGYAIKDRLRVVVLAPGSPAVAGMPPPPLSAASWSQGATAMRGANGRRTDYRCPPGGSAGSVWGSGLYTDDSSICTAAVHAGLISFRRGGPVTIEIRGGAASYAGTTRSGVTSSGYGSWPGSYVLIDESGEPVRVE